MRTFFGKIWVLWAGIFLLGLPPALARANFYEESCQTIRLHGSVENPEVVTKGKYIELTLAYQLNFQKHPDYLRINLPLGKKEFEIKIVGYRQREEGDIYIPTMFLYPRSVRFQYYVKSFGGVWVSAMKSTTYLPAVTRVEESGECQPDLVLDPLKLERRQGVHEMARFRSVKKPESAESVLSQPEVSK
ncbi:MAG: hypothetical protein K8R69_09825 [Deltaproteobacteria bacterium]|nr:hypothetical protein [Deltaproteobacteria bacterium]